MSDDLLPVIPNICVVSLYHDSSIFNYCLCQQSFAIFRFVCNAKLIEYLCVLSKFFTFWSYLYIHSIWICL